jgi:hypothetical protein
MGGSPETALEHSGQSIGTFVHGRILENSAALLKHPPSINSKALLVQMFITQRRKGVWIFQNTTFLIVIGLEIMEQTRKRSDKVSTPHSDSHDQKRNRLKEIPEEILLKKNVYVAEYSVAIVRLVFFQFFIGFFITENAVMDMIIQEMVTNIAPLHTFQILKNYPNTCSQS